LYWLVNYDGEKEYKVDLWKLLGVPLQTREHIEVNVKHTIIVLKEMSKSKKFITLATPLLKGYLSNLRTPAAPILKGYISNLR
jgi:hypothetical protein